MKSFGILLFLLVSHLVWAYDYGRLSFKEATFNAKTGTIDIVYDLHPAQQNYFTYAVEFYYSTDNGQTFNGPLRLMRGDVGGNVRPGPDKVAQWDYSIEAPELSNVSIVFSIRAKARLLPEHFTKFGGPENAGWSALIPGLGDLKVRQGNKYYYWGITAAAVGTAAAGTVFHFKARDSFDQYQTSSTPEEADQWFTQSQSQVKTRNILWGAALAIWITDVTLVYMKGKQNKKIIEQAFPKSTSLKVTAVGIGSGAGLQLSYKF